MKILVDAFGGDNAPLEIVKGSVLAADEFGYEVVLVGDEAKIKEVAEKNSISLDSVSVVHAPDVISMEDEPMEIMKSKNNSSMAKGLQMLANGEGDAFISAGNSGALCAGATLIVKRIKGVKRCAFAPVIPKSKGSFMLIDSGANAECRPEMLRQFGIMGSIYMKNVMVVDSPRVGLVNIGTESTKGDELRYEAFRLLKDTNINFVGNIEARDIPEDIADVVVADGFTGNVILKLYEGMAKTIFGKFKDIFTKNIKGKIAASLIMNDMKKLKNSMDYNKQGGAPLIGISKPVFKAHGSSNAETIKNAIRLSGEYVKRNVVGIIADAIKEYKTQKEEK